MRLPSIEPSEEFKEQLRSERLRVWKIQNGWGTSQCASPEEIVSLMQEAKLRAAANGMDDDDLIDQLNQS